MEAIRGQAARLGDTVGEREVQVNVALSRLGHLVKEAGRASQELEARLGAIVMPCPPQVTGADKNPQAVRCVLADQMHTVSDDLEQTLRRLESVISRLEI